MADPSIIASTAKGRRAQHPTSLSQRPINNISPPNPTLDDDNQFVGFFGCQNQPESSSIGIEISKFISGGLTAATRTTGQLQLIIPMGENEQQLSTSSEIESPDSQNEQPVMMTTFSIQHSDHDHSSITTKRGETTIALSIGDEDHSINDQRLTENVEPDIEDQNESIAISMENPENDSSNHSSIASPIATTPHTIPLHNYSNPKIATYFLGVYPAFLACIAFFTSAKKFPFVTHKSLMRFSLVAYFMAILVLRILFCLYDHLRKPSNNQHFYLRLYKVLAYVYDILWMLAILLVVPALPQH